MGSRVRNASTGAEDAASSHRQADGPRSGRRADAPSAGKGRPTHVRNRLIVAVAVVAAAIAGAGAPSVLAASGQLHDSQELVTLAEQTQDALALAHSLADERDEVTSYIAAGRPKAKAPSEQRSARVDRQVEELRADTDTPASLRSDLDGIAAVRRAALTGKSSALEAHQAYSTAITELHRLAEQLAQQTPPARRLRRIRPGRTGLRRPAGRRGPRPAARRAQRAAQHRTVIDPVTGLPTETSASSDADSPAARRPQRRRPAGPAALRRGARRLPRHRAQAGPHLLRLHGHRHRGQLRRQVPRHASPTSRRSPAASSPPAPRSWTRPSPPAST